MPLGKGAPLPDLELMRNRPSSTGLTLDLADPIARAPFQDNEGVALSP